MVPLVPKAGSLGSWGSKEPTWNGVSSRQSEKIAIAFPHELIWSWEFLGGSQGFPRGSRGSRGPQSWKFRDFEFHGVPGVRINREIKEMAV